MNKKGIFLFIIILIIASILVIRTVISTSSSYYEDKFVSEHVEQLLDYVPDAEIHSITIYKTESEDYLYIQYFMDSSIENKYIIATRHSKKFVTQATATIFPEVISAFNDAKLDYTSQVEYTPEDIQEIIDKIS